MTIATKAGRPVFNTIPEAVEIARALAPKLRERVARAEELRRLPEENVADLLDSGLIDLETPKRFGGPELNLDALLEVTAALAEGCSATGWVYALWGAHVWLIGQFPLHIQQMVFDDPNSLVSSVVNTAGTPEQVPGGYRWTGRGFFSSGVDHCNWLVAAIDLAGNKPPPAQPDRRWFLIPRSDITIVDDWHTVGLRGSGSKTIEVNDIFIPEDHCVEAKYLSEGTGIGAREHGGPLYCAAMDFTFSLPLAGPIWGIANNALAAFKERISTRLASNNWRLAGEQMASIMRISEAGAQIASARALLLEDARRFCFMPAAEATMEDKFQCRRDVGYATQLCRRAVNGLFEAAGGSNLYERADMQRLWRDANAASAHHGLLWDPHALSYGRVSVGLPPMEAPQAL